LLLQLLGKDTIVLLTEPALLLFDRTTHDVLHLVHRKEHLTRLGVNTLPQLLNMLTGR